MRKLILCCAVPVLSGAPFASATDGPVVFYSDQRALWGDIQFLSEYGDFAFSGQTSAADDNDLFGDWWGWLSVQTPGDGPIDFGRGGRAQGVFDSADDERDRPCQAGAAASGSFDSEFGPEFFVACVRVVAATSLDWCGDRAFANASGVTRMLFEIDEPVFFELDAELDADGQGEFASVRLFNADNPFSAPYLESTTHDDEYHDPYGFVLPPGRYGIEARAEAYALTVLPDNTGQWSDAEYDVFLLWNVGRCSAADLASPQHSLDASDVLSFLQAFAAASPGADFAQPVGVIDYLDVLAFLELFAAGCQ